MIVVLASRRDRDAYRLADAWRAQEARVLSPSDLSMAGWRVGNAEPDRDRVVIGGQPVPARDVTGVVTRLTHVSPGELTRLDEADRVYAAQEMTAFLGYWLSTLTCPVLNPPGPVSLCGPGWRAERWLVAAAELGLDVLPRVRRVRSFGAAEDPGGSLEVPSATLVLTVVGERWVRTASVPHEPHDEVAEQRAADGARRLAAAAGAPMASFGFARQGAGLALTGAGSGVNVSHPDVRAAMLEDLQGDASQSQRRRGFA